MRPIFFFTFFAVSRISMALPSDLLILLAPSVPTSRPTRPTSASGIGEDATKRFVFLIGRLVGDAAVHLVESTCDFPRQLDVRNLILSHRHRMREEGEDVRRLPTACSGNPNSGCPRGPLTFISSLRVGLRITRLNGSSIENRYVSSAMAGTSVCRKMELFSGSIPMHNASRTISMESWRMESGSSARVVKACMFATRKKSWESCISTRRPRTDPVPKVEIAGRRIAGEYTHLRCLCGHAKQCTARIIFKPP